MAVAAGLVERPAGSWGEGDGGPCSAMTMRSPGHAGWVVEAVRIVVGYGGLTGACPLNPA
jgi:hypothetical protein